MIFASLIFVFGFLPLFLAGYYALPKRARNLFLTLASYVFYGWWRPDFVLLMLFSTSVDYACARAMGAKDEQRARRPWLLVSVVTNLGLLGWFKYANLLVSTWGDLTGTQPDWVRIVLPVGISFYTFQSMSYTIDVYRGEVRPVRSFLDLACYVSMFPQLVAGPIVRYRDVQDAAAHSRHHTLAKFAAGAVLFGIGLAKKVLIADNVAPIADRVFAHGSPGLIDAWTGVSAYAAQIYFDFSGYSDMAIALGLMIGFRLPKNFDSPYKSESITEFWRRWHVSLSTWLRDYLYVPLGGNRRGTARTYFNLAATMLLGGLWHGAAWTYLLWGAWQGAFLVFERAIGKRPIYAGLPRALRVAVTFAIVLGGWAIFRATSMRELGAVAGGMVGMSGLGELPVPAAHAGQAFGALVLGLGIAFVAPQSEAIVARFRPRTVVLVSFLLLWSLAQLAARDFSPFIYFQF